MQSLLIGHLLKAWKYPIVHVGDMPRWIYFLLISFTSALILFTYWEIDDNVSSISQKADQISSFKKVQLCLFIMTNP